MKSKADAQALAKPINEGIVHYRRTRESPKPQLSEAAAEHLQQGYLAERMQWLHEQGVFDDEALAEAMGIIYGNRPDGATTSPTKDQKADTHASRGRRTYRVVATPIEGSETFGSMEWLLSINGREDPKPWRAKPKDIEDVARGTICVEDGVPWDSFDVVVEIREEP